MRTTPRPVRTLAALAVGVLLTTSACGGDATVTDPVGADRSDPPAATDSPTAPAATDAASQQPAQAGAVPVYYVGDTGVGPRLFREFRKVSGEPALGAAEMAAAGSPADPDYRSLFPAGGGFASVEHDDETITVRLSDESWVERAAGMSRPEAQLAVQALVYTVQGALQTRDPVTVSSPDGATTLLGVETAGGLTNADQLEVLNLVSITSPEQGAEVSGTFTASGIASSFEATVPWEVRDGSDAVVARGFATAEGWMDALYPWSSEVDVSDLAPGSYTFIAMTDDPSGGEGNPPMFDTKEITVG